MIARHFSLLAGAGCLAGAGLLGVAAAFDAAPSAPDLGGDVGARPSVVATSPAPPTSDVPTTSSTVEVTRNTGTTRQRAPERRATTTTAPRLSPLNRRIGRPISVVPEPVAATVPPVAVTFDAVGLNSFPVATVGLDAEGQLEVPDETQVGWYRNSSTPGEAGATVLAAHVSWNDTLGPFFRLAETEPGVLLELALADGSTRTYQVVERAQYDKQELPADRIWTDTGPETLVLITCGGEFNPDIRSYYDNIVVYAVPVDGSVS